MSMSEFERQENIRDEELSSLFIRGLQVPNDFTEEELAFAAELNALFSPEVECLPPLYVQTLLDVDDQRFEPVECGFEHKTSVRVFQRLKLRRRLFYGHMSFFGAFNAGISDAPTRRSILTVLVAFALIMVLTVAFTGASFASGVAILLRGTHAGGVYLADKYPVGMVQNNLQSSSEPSVSEISLLAAQQKMHFPIDWPHNSPFNYTLKNINLYAGPNQQWADGPMLEFEFSLPPSGVASKGTGEVWVREFKPRENVLQLVEKNAAIPIQMDNSGRALAIYVNGQWESRGRNAPVWVSGERSELIYQLNGVVFWIVGDQRDGVGEQQLMQVAQGLTPAPSNYQSLAAKQITIVNEMQGYVPGPFTNDVIVLFPNNGATGPYYTSVSSYPPPDQSASTS